MNANTKTEVVAIAKLIVGDFIVNLGSILEIEERDTYFWLVIDRMNERQVWRFVKTEGLLIRLAIRL